MLKDLFLLSVNNIRRRKLRSWLTMIGIFIGIAAVVSLISLGQGLQTAVTGQFATLSSDKLTIQNSETGFGPPGSTVVVKLNNHDADVVGRVRGVEEVVPRLVRVVKVEYNDVISFNYIGEVAEESEKMRIIYNALNLEIEFGRVLKRGDRGKVVIGPNVAKGDVFGKKIEVGKKINVQGKDFEVVGIMKRGSSFQTNDVIIMLNDDMEELLGIDDEIDMIIAQIDENADIEEVAEKIEDALRKDRDLKKGEENFAVQTPLQSISTVNQTLSIINLIIVGIALVSLVVGGIGIANTMYASVLERKKEIGTMKAIGAMNRDILTIFLIESGLLGFVGGLIGVLIGAGLAVGLSGAANGFFGTQLITVNLSIPLMVSVLLFSGILGIIFGGIPSYQASKLKPVDALRG
jgi:putative ABC transport system permease protein